MAITLIQFTTINSCPYFRTKNRKVESPYFIQFKWWSITSDIQILNTQVGHFTNDITIKNIKQLSEVTDKSSYTHVIYMGEKQEELSTEAKEFLESFPDHYSFRSKHRTVI